ncbi:DUF1027 domain-containing protein [Paenibacillus sp. CC-CFT747]|nr:DUF1027 domain-containing protein [Paenibacillus sp. CC-CFT747]
MFYVGGNTYELIKENKNGWNLEAFKERYSEVLERYDYIVGDWGYNMLRLRGFFKDNNPKGSKEFSISGLEDYLNEYCNFGCAYFIIERTNAKTLKHAPPEEETPEEVSEAGGDRETEGGSGQGPVFIPRSARQQMHANKRQASGKPQPSPGPAKESQNEPQASSSKGQAPRSSGQPSERLWPDKPAAADKQVDKQADKGNGGDRTGGDSRKQGQPHGRNRSNLGRPQPKGQGDANGSPRPRGEGGQAQVSGSDQGQRPRGDQSGQGPGPGGGQGQRPRDKQGGQAQASVRDQGQRPRGEQNGQGPRQRDGQSGQAKGAGSEQRPRAEQGGGSNPREPRDPGGPGGPETSSGSSQG